MGATSCTATPKSLWASSLARIPSRSRMSKTYPGALKSCGWSTEILAVVWKTYQGHSWTWACRERMLLIRLCSKEIWKICHLCFNIWTSTTLRGTSLDLFCMTFFPQIWSIWICTLQGRWQGSCLTSRVGFVTWTFTKATASRVAFGTCPRIWSMRSFCTAARWKETSNLCPKTSPMQVSASQPMYGETSETYPRASPLRISAVQPMSVETSNICPKVSPMCVLPRAPRSAETFVTCPGLSPMQCWNLPSCTARSRTFRPIWSMHVSNTARTSRASSRMCPATCSARDIRRRMHRVVDFSVTLLRGDIVVVRITEEGARRWGFTFAFDIR